MQPSDEPKLEKNLIIIIMYKFIFLYQIIHKMGNIINGTSKHVFGLDKILEKREEEKLRKKKIYPVPVRGRGLYAFLRFMND